MDLIYANKNKEDLGVLKEYQFDLAYGADENNFELTVSINNNVCDDDYLIYIENTEYGGVIDSIEVNTKQKNIKYKGRTFHGLLDKKIISPNNGQAYYTVSGDLNTIIGNLITRLSLGTMFRASTETSRTISNYQFDRYITGYKGICKMLASVNYKLNMSYENGYVVLSAVPIVEYGDDEQIDSDRLNFEIQKTFNRVNHLICLGSGTLANRTVIHLYLNASGQVTTTQYYTGSEEICEVYDYPNAESSEELQKKGSEKLLGQDTNNIELTLGDNYFFDIGDKITVTEIVTNIEVTKVITKKIVTINNDIFKISYKVGE